MPLGDVANYIYREHHLPGLPSAHEMLRGGSFGLGQLSLTLLQKTEENTLYLIELKNQNDAMQTKLDAQQSEIDLLQKEIDELKKR